MRAEQLPESIAATIRSMNPGSLGGPVEVPGGIMLVALIDKRQIGSDPRQAVLNMKQIAISFPPGTTEAQTRSEEHTSELQSLMRISYAVFCLKKKKKV